DLVHSHFWQASYAGEALASAWRIPLVHTHHSLGSSTSGRLVSETEVGLAARPAAERAISTIADAVVVSTATEADVLRSSHGGGPRRLHVVPPGVRHALFRPLDRVVCRSAAGIDDRPVALMVTRIQPLKGIDLAIRSIAVLGHLGGRPPLLVV